MTEICDYVIVGAGSAGCVMANRLTEDGTYSVKVLEFGGSDGSVFIQMPSALSIPMNSPKYDWRYHAEPEPNLGGRSLHTPRGKVLGGSSSINGMVYIRGHALDFDAWEEGGARGWNYASVLPYFKRAEGRDEGGDAYRGASGPLKTSYGTMRNPLYQAFIDAAIQAGYPATNDVNGYQQEGFGRMDMTVFKGWPPLVCRQCLSQAGHEASQPLGRDACLGEPHPLGGQKGRWRRILARLTVETRQSQARGDPRRRADQRSPASQALGHRPGG